MTTIKDLLRDFALDVQSMEIDNDEYHNEDEYIEDLVSMYTGKINDIFTRIVGEV